MRRLALLICLTLSLGCASKPLSSSELPSVSQSGHGLALSDFSSVIQDNSILTSGWIRRASNYYGILDTHLHVDLIDASGGVIQTLEVRQTGSLPSAKRSQRAIPFRSRSALPANQTVSSVRISAQPGRKHKF